MLKSNELLPVILCGGTGSRLWPLSRKSFPKQYLSIDPKANFSFLQTTLNRIKSLENIHSPIIVCNEEHRFITAEQLREINIKPHTILLEPHSKNTAPAIGIAALSSLTKGSDPILLILPSDHQIKNDEEFLSCIKNAQQFACEGKIITFGVKPTSPSTGYGYIKTNTKIYSKELKPYPIEKFF